MADLPGTRSPSLSDGLKTSPKIGGVPAMRAKAVTLLWVAAISLLAACSGIPAPSTASPAPTIASPTRTPTPQPSPASTPFQVRTPTPGLGGDLELWLGWDSDGIATLGRVIEAFGEQYPGVRLHVVYVRPSQLPAAFEEAVQSEVGVTMIIGPSSWGPQLWEAGVLMDMSSYLGGDIHEKIHPLARSQIAYQGAVLGVPIELKGTLLYRNRALVDQPATTVEELTTAARLLNAQGQVAGIPLDVGSDSIVSHIAACGGKLGEGGEGPSLDRGTGICWLSLLTAFQDLGPVTVNSEEDLEMFEAGLAGWLFESSDHGLRLERALGMGNLVIDPWPTYEATGNPLAGYVWTDNLYFAANADPETMTLAWTFATYLLSTQSQRTLAGNGVTWHLPAIANLTLDTVLQRQAMNSLWEGVPRSLSPSVHRFDGPLEVAANMVILERAEPEFALFVALEDIPGLLPSPTPTPTAEVSPTPSE